MATTTESRSALVDRLLALARAEDRAALAALRTGLGKPPGAAPLMLPHIAPHLKTDSGADVEAAFLTAALFATHHEHASVGSLGASLWHATQSDRNPKGKHGQPGVEARLAAALDAAPEDLPHHLRGLVSLCESAGVPIDWYRLHADLRGLFWQDEEQMLRIRTRWAREFWGGPIKKNNESNTPSSEEEVE